MILKVYLPERDGWVLIDRLTRPIIRQHTLWLKGSDEPVEVAAKNDTAYWAPPIDSYIGHVDEHCLCHVQRTATDQSTETKYYTTFWDITGIVNGELKSVIFNTTAYLMNDDGKTVESFLATASGPAPSNVPGW